MAPGPQDEPCDGCSGEVGASCHECTKKKKRSKKKGHSDGIGLTCGGHAIISGCTKTGKTHWVVDAILGKGVHKGRPGPWDSVLVCCDNISINQPRYKYLAAQFTGKGGPVEFYEGLPQNEEEETELLDHLTTNSDNGFQTLVIIDDLMKTSGSGFPEKFVDKMFTSARHINCTVFELNQAHTASRIRRLQASFLACFATPADVRSLAHVAHGIMPEDKGHKILEAYRHAVTDHDGHGCLVICLRANPEYMFRNTSFNVCFDMDALPEPEIAGWT